MSACERCWEDAHRASDVAEEYHRLLRERANHEACSPEQQAGPDAAPCSDCGGRRVRHQITGECMVNASHGKTPGASDAADDTTKEGT